MQMLGLKILRKKMNYTQKMIATELSMSREAISLYETGHRSPSVETLLKMSECLNVSVNFLITGKEFASKKDHIKNFPQSKEDNV